MAVPEENSAYRAVRDLTGVKGVTNAIRIKPRVTATQVQDKIEVEEEAPVAF